MKFKLLILFFVVLLSSHLFSQEATKPYGHLKTGCAETVSINTLEGNTLAVSQEGYTVISYEVTFETASGKKIIKVEGNLIPISLIGTLKMKKPTQVWITNIKLKDTKGNISDSADMGFNVKY
ncbi:MAG: hypothetical protein WCK02_03780 [Bacteroidota bacterium]